MNNAIFQRCSSYPWFDTAPLCRFLQQFQVSAFPMQLIVSAVHRWGALVVGWLMKRPPQLGTDGAAEAGPDDPQSFDVVCAGAWHIDVVSVRGIFVL